MDQKTLDYMGERVDKARNIQKKISELKHFIEYSDGKNNLCILDHNENGPRIKPDQHHNLALRAKAAILNEIQKEIEALEKELAEL